jgi:hypothetical protein
VPSMFEDIVGTVRSAFAGDPRATSRMGAAAARWSRVLIEEHAQERLELLLAWVDRVHSTSELKWYPPERVEQCRVIGRTVDCRARAIAPCSCCGRPVCMQHAMLSADADVLCAPCFAVARQHAKPWEPPRPTAPAGKDPTDVATAYEILGADPEDSDEEIRKIYRQELAKAHPDRKRTKTAKERAEARFKTIQAAWDTIQRARGTPP